MMSSKIGEIERCYDNALNGEKIDILGKYSQISAICRNSTIQQIMHKLILIFQ